MIERMRPALGTFVQVSVDPLGLSDLQVERAITLAFAAIDLTHQLMSVHDAHSDLSMLNQSAHLTSYRTHPWTLAVLRRALRVYAWSDGVFDCVVAARQLTAWRMLPNHSLYSADSAAQPATLADVSCLTNGTVRFNQPLALDFGGIAKGFAVDMAVLALYRSGVRTAVVNAGGDLRVLGATAQPVAVRHPQDPQQLMAIGTLAHGAVASSAVYYSAIQNDAGQMVSALVDPRDQRAVIAAQSWTVIAPTAVMADGLTKVLAVTQDDHHPALIRCGAQAIILGSFGLSAD